MSSSIPELGFYLEKELGVETLSSLRMKSGYLMDEFAKALNEDINIVCQYGNKDIDIDDETIDKISSLICVDKERLLKVINNQLECIKKTKK